MIKKLGSGNYIISKFY